MGEEIIVGLRNEQNDCYINSVIQCLASFSWLRSYFRPVDICLYVNRKSESRGIISMELAKLFNLLRRSSTENLASNAVYGDYPSVANLKYAIEKYHTSKFGCHQQDAHEFFMVLLNFLHEELRSRTSSFISTTFEGKQRSTLTCQACGYESSKEETFFVLTLEVGDNKRGARTLRDLVVSYLTPEPVYWKCTKCKKSGFACKKIDIVKLPRVLAIHLSRFFTLGGTEKNYTIVEFDFELDLEGYSQSKDKYLLHSVCNHFGGMQNGHYNAYIYATKESKWFKVDDELVEEVDFQEIVSPAAYILFYGTIR